MIMTSTFTRSIDEEPFLFYTLSCIVAGFGLGIASYGIMFSLVNELYTLAAVFVLIGGFSGAGFLYIYSEVAPVIDESLVQEDDSEDVEDFEDLDDVEASVEEETTENDSDWEFEEQEDVEMDDEVDEEEK